MFLAEIGKDVGDFEKAKEWAEKAYNYILEEMLEISDLYFKMGYYKFSMKILEQIYTVINELKLIDDVDRDYIIKNLSLNIIKIALQSQNSSNNLKPSSS